MSCAGIFIHVSEQLCRMHSEVCVCVCVCVCVWVGWWVWVWGVGGGGGGGGAGQFLHICRLHFSRPGAGQRLFFTTRRRCLPSRTIDSGLASFLPGPHNTTPLLSGSEPGASGHCCGALIIARLPELVHSAMTQFPPVECH